MRPNDHLNSWSIVWWWVRDVAFVLVDLASILLNSLCLSVVFWLVVFRQQQDFFTSINRHDSSAITNISHIACVSHDHYNDGTGSTSFDKVFFRSTLLVSPLKENLFWLSYSVFYSYFRILGEVVVSNNELMKLVSKVVSTGCSTMAIIHSEEWASRPLVHLFELWLDDVEDDADSVLIIISHNSLMSVSWIAAHHSVLFASKLGWMVRIDISVNLFLLHLHIFLLLLCSHDEASIGDQLVLGFRLGQTTLVVWSLLLWRACLFVFLNLLVVRWWWLGMTWLFSFSAFIISLGVGSILLLVLVLSHAILLVNLILLLLRDVGIGFVSHPWAGSQAIHPTLG